MAQVTEEEWRCTICRTLFGIIRNDRLYIRHRKLQFVVTGPVMAVCRQCSTINEIVVDGAQPTSGRAA